MSILVLAAMAALQQPVPVYDNLGTWSHPISSRNPLVQQYFDQGLRLTYGFNHGEAIRAFREAARIDSTCAICWWGVANAYGPNINMPMDSASGAAAWEAHQRAVRLRSHASAAERRYIDAQAVRFGADPMANRANRDSAYVATMTAVSMSYPRDLDAATLAAEAKMNLSPWNYWTDGVARPGTDALVAMLERVIAREPNHPGACHFYIHAVEASARPERALPCARRLAALMPGAGHLVHMPAHVYIRLGMFEEAEQANVHAAHADEQYIADARPDGIYAMAYYPHNLHFLWAAAAFQGRRADAEAALDRLSRAAPVEMIRNVPPFELFALPLHYHRVWFGDWDGIQRVRRPPSEMLTSTALWFYARGRAFAAQNNPAAAKGELDSLRALRAGASARLPAGMTLGFAPPSSIMDIAVAMLDGEIAAKERRFDAAVAALRQAVTLADGLTYNEPADWYYPPRLSLGAVLLEAGRAAEAEAVYREDLRINRNSGWALTGLVRALEAQNKTNEAATARTQLERAWSRADVRLTGSRL